MEQSKTPTLESLSLRQTKKFSKLIMDLEERKDQLSDFISFPNSIEGFRSKIEDRKRFQVNRELLVESLKKQYAGLKLTSHVDRNLNLLLEENTFTVTTGHQLNIFTGPIYFHYKILSVIKLSEELKTAFPEYNFIPVYWMNSEDHDIDEVGQVSLFGETFRWENHKGGATGRMNPKPLVQIADQLKEKLRSDAALELLELMRTSYNSAYTLTDATRTFVNEIYEEQGLVIVDSDDAKLKQPFGDIVAKELEHSVLSSPISRTSERLNSLGYHTQVNPRPVNFFHLDDNGRKLLERHETGFQLKDSDQKLTIDELRQLVNDQPERFSYNVISRPLFQEFMLPNLAYIGGGGELAYWLQYKEMFNEMNVSFPVLTLRDSFLMIDSKSAQKLAELEIPNEDLFLDEELLVNGFLASTHSEDLDMSDLEQDLNAFYDKLSLRAELLDKGLKQGVEAERAKQNKSIKNWEGRFRKALKSRSEVSVNRLRKIHQQLFPNGGLQERSMNILEAIERFGPDFLKQTKAHEEPLSTNRYAVVKF